MLFFAKVGKTLILNLACVSRVVLCSDGCSYVNMVGVEDSVSLNAEETKQLLDDMDHAATLYRIEQNLHVKGIQEH